MNERINFGAGGVDVRITTAGIGPFTGPAREQAYNIIRRAIISLELKPGETLSDKQLAEQLNMSRTPVREALILLAASKMVVLKPQAGTFVAPIDLRRMEMEQFARYVMEKEIVTQACNRVTDSVKWQYEENLRTFRHYDESGEPDRITRLLELDNAFHRIAFVAVDREANFDQMLAGMQHVERMRILSIAGVGEDQTYRDHVEISGAVLSGNTVSAQYWIDCHLNRYRENLRILEDKYPDYFSLQD